MSQDFLLNISQPRCMVLNIRVFLFRYAFTLERMVALGFIINKDIKTGDLLPVTTDYVMDREALYQIDIAGRRFNVRQSLHPPRLPSASTVQSRDYHPTLRDKSILQAKQ